MTKVRVVVLLGVIVVALGWVAAQALSSNLVYYQTPTELLAKGAPAIGERVRLGGLVARGSIQQLSGGRVRFILTDGTSRMTVLDSGDVPLLFKDGKGVGVHRPVICAIVRVAGDNAGRQRHGTDEASRDGPAPRARSR